MYIGDDLNWYEGMKLFTEDDDFIGWYAELDKFSDNFSCTILKTDDYKEALEIIEQTSNKAKNINAVIIDSIKGEEKHSLNNFLKFVERKHPFIPIHFLDWNEEDITTKSSNVFQIWKKSAILMNQFLMKITEAIFNLQPEIKEENVETIIYEACPDFMVKDGMGEVKTQMFTDKNPISARNRAISFLQKHSTKDGNYYLKLYLKFIGDEEIKEGITIENPNLLTNKEELARKHEEFRIYKKNKFDTVNEETRTSVGEIALNVLRSVW